MCDNMKDKVYELRKFGFRQYRRGVSGGIAIMSTVALIADYLDDKIVDHPLLFGIPLAVSVIHDIYQNKRHGSPLKAIDDMQKHIND
jgi:hypothetical protein